MNHVAELCPVTGVYIRQMLFHKSKFRTSCCAELWECSASSYSLMSKDAQNHQNIFVECFDIYVSWLFINSISCFGSQYGKIHQIVLYTCLFLILTMHIIVINRIQSTFISQLNILIGVVVPTKYLSGTSRWNAINRNGYKLAPVDEYIHHKPESYWKYDELWKNT
jgi:hypothetical protein